MDVCSWYVPTHWSVCESPCVAIAHTALSDPRSTCRYGELAPSAAHHGSPGKPSLAFLAGVLLLKSDEEVSRPSGIVTLSRIPSSWLSHEPRRNIYMVQYHAIDS